MDQTAYPFVSRICLTVVIGVPLSLRLRRRRTPSLTGALPSRPTLWDGLQAPAPHVSQPHDDGLALCQCCTAVLPHHEPSGAHWCLSISGPGENGCNRRLVSEVIVRLHRMPIRFVPRYQLYRPSL